MFQLGEVFDNILYCIGDSITHFILAYEVKRGSWIDILRARNNKKIIEILVTRSDFMRHLSTRLSVVLKVSINFSCLEIEFL